MEMHSLNLATRPYGYDDEDSKGPVMSANYRADANTPSFGFRTTSYNRLYQAKSGRKRSSEKRQGFVNSRSCGNSVWLLESLSFLLAVVALVAIITLLATHLNKPQPKWPSYLSINSLVAVFTSTMKAAMLLPLSEGISELKWIWFSDTQPLGDFDRYDLASRGPLGAVQLLFNKRRHLIASLGAIIIILALAIDPFTQQIVQIRSCQMSEFGILSWVSRTNNYTVAGFHTGAGELSLDPRMQAALYQGVLNPPANATASIPFICPTGNCTFPAHDRGSLSYCYNSLAICSSVEDISNTVIGNGSYYNYSLPSGITVYESNVFSIAGIEQSYPPTPTISSIFTFEALMVDVTGQGSSTASEPAPSPFAIRAALYPCLQTYDDVNVTRFILQEPVHSSMRLPMVAAEDEFPYFALAGEYPSIAGSDCSWSDVANVTHTMPASQLPDGTWYFNISIFPEYGGKPDASIRYYTPECSYEFSPESTMAIGQALPSLFGFVGPDYSALNLSTPEGSLLYTVGNAWLEVLYQNGTADLASATAYMEGLANSMTAVVRGYGDLSNSAWAPLSSLEEQICISVEWGWLALPIILLTLTLVFFIAVVIQSSRSRRSSSAENGRQPWKSSSLPLLWTGLSDSARQRYGTLNKVESMQTCSEELHVSLRRLSSKKFGDEDPFDEYGEPNRGNRGRWVLKEKPSNGIIAGEEPSP